MKKALALLLALLICLPVLGGAVSASAAMATHVLEVIDGIIESGRTDRFVGIESTFERPAPLNLPVDGEESSLQ